MSNTEIVNQEENVIDEAKQREEIERAAREEMARSMGAELKGPEPEPEITKSADQEVDNQPEDDKPAVPSLEDRFQQLLEENQKLRKAIDTTNGRYGQELQVLRNRLDAVNKSPDLKSAFENISVDNPAFESLKNDFPEMAEQLINSFRKALIGDAEKQPIKREPVQPAETIQPETIDTKEEPDQFNKKMAMGKLEEKHPDFLDLAQWKEIPLANGISKIEWKNKAFGEWLEAQSEDVRNLIFNGKSPAEILEISDVLTEYKKSIQADKEPEPEQQQETNIRKIKPDLKRSLLPDGRQQGKTVSLTEDEIIEAAKREEMKKVMTGIG